MKNTEKEQRDQAARNYAEHKFEPCDFIEREFARLAFIAGSNWQKRQQRKNN